MLVFVPAPALVGKGAQSLDFFDLIHSKRNGQRAPFFWPRLPHCGLTHPGPPCLCLMSRKNPRKCAPNGAHPSPQLYFPLLTWRPAVRPFVPDTPTCHSRAILFWLFWTFLTDPSLCFAAPVAFIQAPVVSWTSAAFLLITCSLHSNFRKANESTLRCRHCKYHSLVTYFPWSLVKCEFKGCSALSGVALRLQAHFTFIMQKGKKKKKRQSSSILWILLTVWLISISMLYHYRTVHVSSLKHLFFVSSTPFLIFSDSPKLSYSFPRILYVHDKVRWINW